MHVHWPWTNPFKCVIGKFCGLTLSRPIFLTGHVLLTPWPTWVSYVRSIVVVVVKKGIEGCMNAFILSYFGPVLCTLYYGLFSRNSGANLPRGLLLGDPKGQPWLGSPIWPHLRLTLTHHNISRLLVGWFGPKASCHVVLSLRKRGTRHCLS